VYTTGVTRVLGVVLRPIGAPGHFWSRVKDGSRTIPSVVAENPLLYSTFTALSSMEQELLPIEVLHCGNREFRVFFGKKIVKNINFSLFAPQKNVDDEKVRLLSHKTRTSVKRCDLYRCASIKKTGGVKNRHG